jgi:hypothetical protein
VTTKRTRPTVDLDGKQRLLQEFGSAQSLTDLHGLVPAWCDWFDQQPDGKALDEAMAELHDAFGTTIDALTR